MTTRASNSITARPAHRRCRLPLLVALLLTAALPGTAPADAEPDQDVNERKAAVVKAGLLCSLFKYVDWPRPAMGKTSDPLTIGVIGDDPLGTVIEAAVRDQVIKKRSIVIDRFETISGTPVDAVDPQLVARLRACHMLFVCRSEKPALRQVIELVENAPVLTVSDIASFARDDGMIEAVIDKRTGKYVLHINKNQADAAGLEISSQLLRAAKIVESRRR